MIIVVTVVIYTLASLWVPGLFLLTSSLTLLSRHRIRLRRFYGMQAWGNAMAAVAFFVTDVVIILDVVGDGSSFWGMFWTPWFTFWVYVCVRSAVRNYRLWRDSDDDHWWKRVREWAKSHLPKPTLVRLRPMPSPA